MRYRERRKSRFRVLSFVMGILVALLVRVSSYAGFAEGEMRTKHGSSRQNNDALACDDARESALKLARLDCLTSGGAIAMRSDDGAGQ